MLIATLLRLLGIPLQFLGLAVYAAPRKFIDSVFFRCQHGTLSISQKNDLFGVGQDGRRVRRDEAFLIPDTKDDGRSHARRDELVGFAFVLYRDTVCSADIVKSGERGFLEVLMFFEVLFHKMRDNFRIGIGNECVPPRNKILSEFLPILDDAVVHYPYLLVTASVRMRVLFRRLSVRRPAQVRDAAFSGEFFRHFLPQFFHGTGGLYASALGRIDAGGVVPAVLQRDEPLQKKVRRVLTLSPCIRKNTAHIKGL